MMCNFNSPALIVCIVEAALLQLECKSLIRPRLQITKISSSLSLFSTWSRSPFMLQNSSICFLFIWSLCVTKGEKLPSTLQNSNYKISAVVFKLHSDNFKYAQVAEHRAVWTSNQLAFFSFEQPANWIGKIHSDASRGGCSWLLLVKRFFESAT